MPNKLIQRAYEILKGITNDRVTKGFQIFIITLISVNVLVVIIETEESLLDEYGYFFIPFEVFSIRVFTCEYASRLLVCKLNPKYTNTKFATLRYALTKSSCSRIAVSTIPTGIMASAFTEELRKKRLKPRKCLHYGKDLN